MSVTMATAGPAQGWAATGRNGDRQAQGNDMEPRPHYLHDNMHNNAYNHKQNGGTKAELSGQTRS